MKIGYNLLLKVFFLQFILLTIVVVIGGLFLGDLFESLILVWMFTFVEFGVFSIMEAKISIN